MKTKSSEVPIDTLALRFNFISSNLNGLLGKVLTFIDATYSDEVQRKAAKDIIKNDIFAKTHDWFDEVCHTDLSNREPYGQWGRPFPEDTVEIK